MKLNIDKALKFYTLIISSAAIVNGTLKANDTIINYKTTCENGYKYKKNPELVKDTGFDNITFNPCWTDLTSKIIFNFMCGMVEGAAYGLVFPISIPSGLYCMKINNDIIKRDAVK